MISLRSLLPLPISCSPGVWRPERSVRSSAPAWLAFSSARHYSDGWVTALGGRRRLSARISCSVFLPGRRPIRLTSIKCSGYGCLPGSGSAALFRTWSRSTPSPRRASSGRRLRSLLWAACRSAAPSRGS